MDKKKKMIAWVIGFVALFLVLWSTPVIDIFPSKYSEFASCLTENGAKMYGAYWCPHCADQKKLFGGSWKHVDYIECSLPNRAGQTQECTDERIESYPTWEVNGERRQGLLSLNQLSQLTGCSLP